MLDIFAASFVILTCGAAVALAAAPSTRPASDIVVVDPQEIDDVFANPGMGWQTFHSFATDPANRGGPPSGNAYFRFYWREIEPAEGQIDFRKFDDLLARARAAGQTFAFRVMCAGSGQPIDVPPWLKDKGARGYDYASEGKNAWVPDFDDPIFKVAHDRLIRELGRRYNGHPDLDHVDIGSVGLWGEWHMSETKRRDNGQEVALPPPETRRAIIDAWRAAFDHTPTLMLIGDIDGLAHATSRGSGWRADCLGDMGGFSKTWNHMRDLYPKHVADAGARDAWKNAPVAFESCWDMRKWVQEGWDVRGIFDVALDTYHASFINNKSAPIPEVARPEVDRLLRRLGYRLVLRRLEHPADVPAGTTLRLSTRWENAGVAPPYRDDRIAVRLRPADGSGQAVVMETTTSVRGWLPGARAAAADLSLPNDLKPGRYDVSIAVVRAGTTEPAVRLAIAGRGDDGWYPLSHVDVARPQQ
jgi:hypothetical protein